MFAKAYMNTLQLVFASLLILTGSVCIGADDPPPKVDRNGDWLISGIRVYERIRDNTGTVTLADAQTANLVFGYIRGVLDVQDSNVLKALISEAVINEARKTHSKLNPVLIQQLNAAANEYAPLWNSDFYTTEMTADRMMEIVKVYLEKHPERWGKHANDLIEAAFLDAMGKKVNDGGQ